jgi:hypothetical protein
MLTNFADEQKTLESLLEEGQRLAASMPMSHRMANELQAVLLVAKMHAAGFKVAMADAASCVERMRIAVANGVYPQDLLRESKVAAREMQEAV